MTIRVCSFDYDGCLSNPHFRKSGYNDIIESNKRLLDSLNAKKGAFSKTYVFVGSNRQSKATDKKNANFYGNGSCFPAIAQVSQYLGAIFDRFLLADIYGDLQEGSSFARAKIAYEGEHSQWLFDETKATVMYAQMHKIANENPNDKIELYFWDDKIEILDALKKFYSEHSYLMPKNVTLNLIPYAGKEGEAYPPINGTGFIDANYRQTVKDLTAQAAKGDPEMGVNLPIYVANSARPELLQNRKDLSIIIKNEQQAKEKCDIALKRIAEKAVELQKSRDEFHNENLHDDQQSKTYYSYKNAAQAASTLHADLCEAL